MKYFVVSDVHGEYKALVSALEKSGFNKYNPDHTLISLGDNFDKGKESRQVYDFLLSLQRCICIKGDHEYMLDDVFSRRGLNYNDIGSGVHCTIASLNGVDEASCDIYDVSSIEKAEQYRNIDWWLGHLKYYYETENYIFVHSWVTFDDNTGYYGITSDRSKWYEVAFEDVFRCIRFHRSEYPYGWKKTIVFGHHHTCDLHSLDKTYRHCDYDKVKSLDFGIWRDTEHKLIGIDGCSNLSKIVNVLVLED